MLKTFDPMSLITLTKQLLEQLYSGRPLSIAPYLGREIVWVNSAYGHCLSGCNQVKKLLESPCYGINYPIRHLQYYLSLISSTAFLVAGSYQLGSQTINGVRAYRQYQITCIWNTESPGLRLLHVHISSTPPLPTSDTLCLHGRHAETYFVSFGEVLYVEAENIYCNIHCLARTLSICHSIGQMEGLLPKQFLRIHRSFIINRQYVTRIYRYGVELYNGVSLPIPEKRYMEVLCRMEHETVKGVYSEYETRI